MNSILLSRNGQAIWSQGYLHQFDGCAWNSELAKFYMALGTWMQDFATGWMNRYTSDYFDNKNSQLQQARDEYYNYLYSVTNPHFVPGIDFHAEDLYYIDPDLCN